MSIVRLKENMAERRLELFTTIHPLGECDVILTQVTLLQTNMDAEAKIEAHTVNAMSASIPSGITQEIGSLLSRT